MDEITWNEVICLIDRIVHEIRMALSHELHLSALALALTLPDTCGKAEYPNEDITTACAIKTGVANMSLQIDVIPPTDRICPI